jgi:ABC-type transport system involved in multi-copper enzyme maturation permease subunit
MLKTIIAKELLNNIYNTRFIIGFILCLIITTSCVVILSHDYQQELNDYHSRISMQDEFLREYAHTNRIYGMIIPQRPPEQFRPLVVGIPQDVDLNSFDDNPLPILFPPLDLIFIVTIIMSLMAILFSYDAIAGERENGTLKLMLTNSFSRAKVILGKWIGGSLSLAIPFLFSLLLGSLYIMVHPAIDWDSSSWLTFILLIFAAIIFISLFHLIGLMISSFSRYSATSVLTSLFIWVLLILIIPNVSPYLSAQLYNIPSVYKIEAEIGRIRGIDRDNLGIQMISDFEKRFAQEYGQLFTNFKAMNSNEMKQRTADDPQFAAMYRAYNNEIDQIWEEANRIQKEKAEKIQQELTIKAAVQSYIAKYIACVSPYANIVYLMTDMTGTGLQSLTYFDKLKGEFYTMFDRYLDRKYMAMREKDPTFSNNSFIDVGDRPRFIYREESISAKLLITLPHWGILILFVVIIFSVTFMKFMRYDVR